MSKGKKSILTHDCANCGDVASLKCARCDATYYCGRDCQKQDWKDHKGICIPPESRMPDKSAKKNVGPSKDVECSICLSPVEPSETTVLSCSHVFHDECVKQLRKYRITACPNCRAEVVGATATINFQDIVFEYVSLLTRVDSWRGLSASHQAEADTLRRKFETVAASGVGEAFYILGDMHESGQGVPQSSTIAATNYLEAALKGDVPAFAVMGMIYEFGRGFPQDYKESLQWYVKAADAGDLFSSHNLGVFFRDGLGVKIDEAEAYRRMKVSSDGGFALAQSKLGVMHQMGCRGATGGLVEAVRLFKLSASQGCAEGQCNLAQYYVSGLVVPKSLATGINLYFLASRQGDHSSQTHLRRLMDDEDPYIFDSKKPDMGSLFTPKRTAEVWCWCREAAFRGDLEASYVIGRAYHFGDRGINVSYHEAAKYYKAPAEGGHLEAQAKLGYLYLRGTGVAQSYDKAVRLFELAAAQGHDEAHVNLGSLYYNGEGVAQDKKRASVHYEKAADLGNEDARERLVGMMRSGEWHP